MEIDLQLASPVRTGAPLLVDVTLTDSESIRKGVVSIQLRDSRRTLLNYRSPTIAVSSEPTTFRWLLPAPMDPQETKAAWHLQFISDQATVERTIPFLHANNRAEYTCVVGLVQSAHFTTPFLEPLVSMHRLESLMDVPANDPDIPLRTVTTTIPLESFPHKPLALTPYDILVFAPDTLSTLRESQSTALQQWIQAGGTCLHLENQLLKQDRFQRARLASRAIQISLDDTNGKAIGWQWGLGCLVHATPPRSESELSDGHWHSTFAFLWRVRDLKEIDKALLSKLESHGESRQRLFTLDSNNFLEFNGNTRRVTLHRNLMPSEFQLLPVSHLIAFVTASLALLFLMDAWLARLKRRRWLSWYFYPLTVVALALASLHAAEAWLGTGESVRRLTLIDLGADGKGVRSTEVRLRFGKGHGSFHESHRDGIVNPAKQVAEYFPHTYTHTGEKEAWTPHLSSVLRIPSAAAIPAALEEINWESVRPQESRSPSSCETRLRAQLFSIKTLDGVVFLAPPKADLWAGSGPSASLLRDLFQPGSLAPPPHRCFGHFGSRTGEPLPFPSPWSPRGDEGLSDWLICNREQWILTWSEGEDRVIVRYVYPQSH